jgi:hypothetical protein
LRDVRRPAGNADDLIYDGQGALRDEQVTHVAAENQRRHSIAHHRMLSALPLQREGPSRMHLVQLRELASPLGLAEFPTRDAIVQLGILDGL